MFVAVDHCTNRVHRPPCGKSGSRFEALEPIRQGVRERFGAIGKGVAHGLRLRHDHGSNYLADDFQQEVAFFGIESSPSFVREPKATAVAERFISTLKENVLWVRSFDTIEELRLALLEFKRTYNEHWMLERYDYRSPAQVRRDLVGLGRGSVEANTVKPLSKNPGAIQDGEQSFMTSPHRHSPLTSLAWSHHATTRVPGKPGQGGTRCRDVIFETLVRNPVGIQPHPAKVGHQPEPSDAWAGVTQGAKRSQGVRRPRDGAPKCIGREGRRLALDGRLHRRL